MPDPLGTNRSALRVRQAIRDDVHQLVVVMVPWAVSMSMLQLFRRSVPYLDDFDFKREWHPG